MKNFSKLLSISVTTLALAGTMLFGFGAAGAQAATCWQYKDQGLVTSTTPVFNNICNVPFGTGDESDFVRVRPDTTGDPTSTGNNGDYTSQLNSTCQDGAKFDVHTYIHNDAMSDSNNNGSGTAVAHDVKLAMSAPLDNKATSFTFGSTVSASNAASVHDTATVSCKGEAVKLSLVPHTVHIYSQPYGSWKDLSNSAVNGTTKIGTPVFGSGDFWGCWQYRTWVVYEVQVHKVKTPPTTPPTTPTPPTPTPPTHLPNTGPGEVVALFGASSGLGAVSHWFYRRRRQ